MDGISLWAYDGGGEMLDKTIALTTSAPDFIVYRNPSTTEPDEPTVPDMSTTDEPGQADSGGGLSDGDEDEGIGDGLDGPTDFDGDADPETAPALLAPPANSAVDNPTIQFGVRVAGYQSWRATIKVYSVADGNGALGTPIASLTTTQTSVTWNQLFPNTKPPSGVYFYDVVLEGILDPAQPPARERLIGLDGTGKESKRLEDGLQVSDLQYRLLDESSTALAQAQRRRRIASASPKAVALLASLPDDSQTDERTSVEVKFRLSNSQASSVTLWAVTPQLKPEYSISAETIGDGWYRGVWTLDIDSVEKMGDYILVATARGGKGQTIPAKTTSRLQIDISGYAIGFEDGSGNSTGRRIAADSTINFRAFIRIKKPGSSSWKWYSGENVSSTTMARIAWIGGWVPQGYPASANKLATAWRSALGLSIKWRKFSNAVIDQKDVGDGKYRWYGFNKPIDSGNGFLYPWKVAEGVSWWGARIACNGTPNWKNGRGKYGRWVYQFPTDQQGGKQLFLAGKSQLNTVTTGFNGGITNKVIWSPDPAATSASTWRGLISGIGLNRSISLDPDDPFLDGKDQNFRARQSELQGAILREAVGFINTPYGWGGQNLGGLQSRSSSRQKGNVTYSLIGDDIIDVLPSVNDSQKAFSNGTVQSGHRTGFGIDCSGLITEAGYLAGLRGTDFSGMGSGTGNLIDTGLAQNISSGFVRAGDFIVWHGHVVYVWQVKKNEDNIITGFQTLEANGRTKSDGRGRTRYDSRSIAELANLGAVSRRWKAQ